MTLLEDLEGLGYETDFKQIPRPAAARWEQVTLLKSRIVLNALTRNPSKVVVFVDVDCRVLGPLDELVANPRATSRSISDPGCGAQEA
jgi:hypothetical protein